MESLLHWDFKSPDTDIVYNHYLPWHNVSEFTVVSDPFGHNIYLHTMDGNKFLLGTTKHYEKAISVIGGILKRVGRDEIIFIGDVTSKNKF